VAQDRARVRSAVRAAGFALVLVTSLSLTASASEPPLKLVFGTDHDFPPYSFVSAEGKPAGFTVDLVRAVGRAAGREVEVQLGEWPEIRRRLEESDGIDVVDMYESEERRHLYDFSAPFQIAADEIFVRSDSPGACSASDLSGRKVLVEAKSYAREFLDRERPNAVPLPAMSEPAALRRLATGEGDCAIVSQFVGRRFAEEKELDNLQVAGPPINPRNHAFAVRKGNAELLAGLNRGLSAVRASGRYGEISEKWLTVRPAELSGYEVLRRASLVLGPIALVAIAALGWSWTLRRRVRKRTEELQAELVERQRAERALRESEQRFRALVDEAPEAILVIDVEAKEIQHANAHASRLLGIAADSTPDLSLLVPAEEDRRNLVDQLERAAAREKPVFEHVFESQGGGSVVCEVRLVSLPSSDRRLVRASIADISDRKRAEQTVAQSQRMEALGRLAGGVAHDFNNLLTVITANTELMRTGPPSREGLAESAEEILDACWRASALTRQLLAFGRRQPTQPVVLEANALVREMQKLLKRTLSADILLEVELAEDAGRVRTDPAQLEQVLLNLVINARDAMPEGGRIFVRTRRNHRDAPGADGVPAGDWVVLEVADTGPGIPEAIRARIFEPFFSTKEGHGGTGLGLAIVYSVATSCGGKVTLDSEENVGSTFRVFLPRTTEAVEAPSREIASRRVVREALVLLVEDETPLRRALERILAGEGYEVVARAGGEEALAQHAAAERRPDLLITDVVMPGMGGRRLAELLRQRQPELPVLFITGHTDDTLLRDGALPPHSRLLAKPFGREEIVGEIEALLVAASPGATEPGNDPT
jgi:two-component system cell cycle sensor histidine kinase/response regulator CckA